MGLNTDNDTKRSDLAAITADITGYSDRYVRMVINGNRNNDLVFETYMMLREGKDSLINAAKEEFNELKQEWDEIN